MLVTGVDGHVRNCIVAGVFPDTNVLAYLFDDHSPIKQARAEEVLGSDHSFVVSTQVMLELFSVLTRKFSPPLSNGEAEQVLSQLSRWEVVSADAELVLQAVRTCAEHQISIWDAMIVEAARLAGCRELWTEDLSDGTQLRGVKVLNPFRS